MTLFLLSLITHHQEITTKIGWLKFRIMYPSRTTGLSYLWTVVSVSQCMLILCKTEISSILSKSNYSLVLVMI